MIEVGGLPGTGAMANGTIMIEIIGYMIGIRYRLEISFMTGKTGIGSIRISRGMTLLTGQRDMSTGNRKTGRSMIKRGWFPEIGRMTNDTVMIKIICHMAWIRGALKIIFMTRITG